MPNFCRIYIVARRQPLRVFFFFNGPAVKRGLPNFWATCPLGSLRVHTTGELWLCLAIYVHGFALKRGHSLPPQKYHSSRQLFNTHAGHVKLSSAMIVAFYRSPPRSRCCCDLWMTSSLCWTTFGFQPLKRSEANDVPPFFFFFLSISLEADGRPAL